MELVEDYIARENKKFLHRSSQAISGKDLMKGTVSFDSLFEDIEKELEEFIGAPNTDETHGAIREAAQESVNRAIVMNAHDPNRNGRRYSEQALRQIRSQISAAPVNTEARIDEPVDFFKPEPRSFSIRGGWDADGDYSK